jgi:transcriptional regulator with XRE-family HTH domain
VTVRESDASVSPRGRTAVEAATGRTRRSQEYRAAREEYPAIRQLLEKNWIAAHIRERRCELDLTQQEVAERAGTSHSFVSRLESGEHIPTISVLKRILAVLDEQLLIGIERTTPGEEHEREIAPAPEVLAPRKVREDARARRASALQDLVTVADGGGFDYERLADLDQ